MIRFSARGHPNITATHATTFELTEDRELSKEGTCIIGVDAKIPSLEMFPKKKKVIIQLKVGSIVETIVAEPNPNFSHGKELVVRKSDFLSERTFAIKADKAAADLDRRMVSLLKNPEQKMVVEIHETEAIE